MDLNHNKSATKLKKGALLVKTKVAISFRQPSPYHTFFFKKFAVEKFQKLQLLFGLQL